MLKILIFYGGVFVFITTTILVWVAWPPKLVVVAVADEVAGAIRCKLRLKRSRRPSILKRISLSKDLAASLGVAPPVGFAEEEKPVSKIYEKYAADPEIISREIVSWSGNVVIGQGQELVLSIPATRPKSEGTIHFHHETRGLAGYLYQREDVKIESSGSNRI